MAECDQNKATAERLAREARLKKLVEIGRYRGSKRYWTVDGIRFELREVGILRDQFIVHFDVTNVEIISEAAPLIDATEPAIAAGKVPSSPTPSDKADFWFSLIHENGTITSKYVLRRTEGFITVEKGKVSYPPLGESGSFTIAFPRKQDSLGSFTIAINDQPIFSPSRYRWKFQRF